jgi:hypothetical protein
MNEKCFFIAGSFRITNGLNDRRLIQRVEPGMWGGDMGDRYFGQLPEWLHPE